MSAPSLSPAQIRALRLANDGGALVRLRGGFWVTQHFADCIERTPRPCEYAGSVTVRKLARLGLLDQLTYGRATLTAEGAEALERFNDQ